MLFNSLTFLIFFALVLSLHHLPLAWRWKKLNLLIASYLFYAAWNPPFVLLLWLSTVVDWWVARAIDREATRRRKRGWLLVSLAVNLGILGTFKYGTFLLENFTAILHGMGVAWEPAAPNLILPIGISFYTFQTLAYSLDVYLGRARPTAKFTDFALFVTFFPQLVAGPIVRPAELVPQFAAPRQADGAKLSWGLSLMTLGLFEKMVLADGVFGPVADAVFGAASAVSGAEAWLGTLAFGGQIFCDFAGYSTTAIGVAACLGFDLPNNFRFPYAACGFSDFWRRWHISLSTWLRDYLYIPLGGNRKGARRTAIHLMLTMLLGGLWHGAAWTFVVWGGLHGLYLLIERGLRGEAVRRELTGGAKWGGVLLTYVAVNFAWVFFRAPDFASALQMALAMVGGGGGAGASLSSVLWWQGSVGLGLVLVTHALMRERSLAEVAAAVPGWLYTTVWAGLLTALVTWSALLFLQLVGTGGNTPFIYFQF